MRLAPPSPRHAGDSGVVAVRPEATEVAVVRLPIADARGAVAGYELLFANGKDGSTPGINARATAAMIDGAFADIGIDRLTGRHMAWLSVARDFLVAVDTPPVRPDRAILQIAAYPAREDLLEVLRRLSMRGYTLALSDYDGSEDLGELMELCTVVKVPFDRVTGAERDALVADLRARGGQIVATGVDDDLVLAEARELGVDLVQGAVLAQPRVVLGRNAASAAAGSLRALADLVGRELDFDQLERIVSSDVALSLKLLRYVNSAFFSLPRTIASVGEALSMLGTRAVQRWAMVVVMADAPEAPDELVELALQRARMCETLAEAIAPEEQATLFTIGMFSVADALIGMPMAEVLAELPFSEEIQAALLDQRGSLGRLLAAVLAYERGEFPELPGIANAGSSSVAGAYRDAVAWAEDTTRVVRSMS